MTVNGIKAENTELQQEVARLDKALAIETLRSADLASEKADDRVQYFKLRNVCRAQEEAITRLTAENEKLRAALGFARGAARLALAKASTTALGDFAVAALEAIEKNADFALEGKQ